MRTLILCIPLFLFACKPSGGKNEKKDKSSAPQPNVLLIIADDLGLTDLGCYGGEIKTTTIDSLAASGILFSNFHSAAMCAPARAKLFSGQDHHLAGWGRQRDVQGSFYEGLWGYENEWSDRVLSFPKLFQEAGYFTSFVGKWHLGSTATGIPFAQGFDKSFALMQGAANHWNDIGLGLSAKDGEVSNYFRDDQKASWPEGQYSTTFYTDETINYLSNNRDKSKPFFAVVSYTAPHWPLQPPIDYKDRYAGKYKEGYEHLRAQRFKASKGLGLLDDDLKLPAGLPQIKPWDSLSPEEQRIESREMELYAASLEQLDDQVKRLLNYLKDQDELSNTLILFMSDNGADFLDFYNNEKYGQFLRSTYSNELENMGDPTSFVAYGAAWAQASMSPYAYYKGYLSEGGIRAPLIISGPSINAATRMTDLVDIRDVAPTLLSLTGINYQTEFQGMKYPELTGRSLLNALTLSENKKNNTPIYVSDFQGKAYVRKDHFKWLNQEDPSDLSKFKLYDLRTDPGEKNDIAANHPLLIKELQSEWEKYRTEFKIKYPDDSSSLNPYKN